MRAASDHDRVAWLEGHFAVVSEERQFAGEHDAVVHGLRAVPEQFRPPVRSGSPGSGGMPDGSAHEDTEMPYSLLRMRSSLPTVSAPTLTPTIFFAGDRKNVIGRPGTP